MPAAAIAAGATVSEELGRQDEQPGLGIEIAGVASAERLGVSGQDLGRVWSIGRQPAGGRFRQRSRCQRSLLHRARLRMPETLRRSS